jgi:hypothetical protein
MDQLLPPETWENVGYYLKETDLKSLCVVSRYLARVIRPLIGRRLSLSCGTSSEVVKELQFYSSNSSAAQNVRDLHVWIGAHELAELVWPSESSESANRVPKAFSFSLLLTALLNMRALENLEIDCSFLETPTEVEQLAEILSHRTRLRGLKIFDYLRNRSSLVQRAGLHLSGVDSSKWKGFNASKSFLHVCHG